MVKKSVFFENLLYFWSVFFSFLCGRLLKLTLTRLYKMEYNLYVGAKSGQLSKNE